LENIVKEAEEEIGLSGVEFVELYKDKTVGVRKYFTQVYLVRCDWPLDQYVKQDEEVEALALVDVDKLLVDVTNHPDKYISNFVELVKTLKVILDKDGLR
jgi:8-oxo-dGTP pyrophosphatase MutT (NUDIX family)